MSSVMRSIKRQTDEGRIVVKQRRQLTQLLKKLRSQDTDEKNIKKHLGLVRVINRLRAAKQQLKGPWNDKSVSQGN